MPLGNALQILMEDSYHSFLLTIQCNTVAISCQVDGTFRIFDSHAQDSLGLLHPQGSPQWPQGDYALLKPKTDCPEGWKDKGWVFLDTKIYDHRKNNRSEILHIDGYVGRNFLVRYFCIKTTEVKGSKNWQGIQGQYCIYRNRESSLPGMTNGSIEIHGEQNDNKDTAKYINSFNKGFYKISKANLRYTEFYFACKTSGNKKIPIKLPITKPFYLLPYETRDCQQVKWMVATTEWIKYHAHVDENGSFPYSETLKDNGIKMYYCYYESCNYTLTETKGVFQSPRFPGKYPDGQLCSWRIKVPANHTVHVRFTNISLDANDVLTFCKRKKGGGLEETYTLNKINPKSSFSHTSDYDIVYVFRSDLENASSGFRAEYAISLSNAVPKTTKSAPTTKWTTTEKRKLQTMERKTNPRTTTLTKITNVSVITQDRQTTTVDHEFSANSAAKTSDCKCTANIKKSYVAENKWSRNWFVVIVIPVALFLLVFLIVVNIAYRCRSVDRLPVVVNPTYKRGAILLNLPSDTAASPAAVTLDVNDDANTLNQPLSERPPDYEDIECYKLDKAQTPNMNPEYNQGCNGEESAGNNVLGDAHSRSFSNETAEQTSKTTENPVYESVLTSPPLVEPNALYESTKVNQGKEKEKETEARKGCTENQEQQGRDRVDQ